MAKTGFIYHESFLKHLTGHGHPERPERLRALINHVQDCDFWNKLIKIEPKAAEAETVKLVHSDSHLAEIQNACKNGIHYLDSDTVVCPESYDVALLAVGAALTACQAVMSGKVDNAFCASRPPGHHAEPSRAMGFCLFNNVAIAARWLQRHPEINRVCIIDWDVHHGNGTQAAFYDDETVFYISVHQHPLYPGTGLAEEKGTGPATGMNLNVPLPAGCSDRDYIECFEHSVMPAVRDFNSDFLLISAGFDAHLRDPLAQMQLTASGFAELTRMVLIEASQCCQGRVVSLLEGGYDLEALSLSVEAHLQVMLNNQSVLSDD